MPRMRGGYLEDALALVGPEAQQGQRLGVVLRAGESQALRSFECVVLWVWRRV